MNEVSQTSTELLAFHRLLSVAIRSKALVPGAAADGCQLLVNFDEMWQSMLDAGLKCFFAGADRPGRPIDHTVIAYLAFVVDRDGFEADPFYWQQCFKAWEFYQWAGIDTVFEPAAS
jgi:hypothetical protein